MENAPLNPSEADSDKKPEGKKKKKSAEALGVFAVDSKPTRAEAESESVWDKLTLTKRKGGETRETMSLSQVLEEAEAHRLPEANEEEAPLEQLGPTETEFIGKEIIAAREAVESTNDHHETGPDEIDAEMAGDRAVKKFREGVTELGQTVEESFHDRLEELGADQEMLGDVPETSTRAPEGPAEIREDEPAAADAESPFTAHRASPAEGGFNDSAQPASAPEASSAADADEEKADRDTTASASSSTSGSGGGGTVPPILSGPAGGGQVPPLHPNMAANYYPSPAGPTHSTAEKQVVPYYNNGELLGAAFLGGFIGYLIGRRRGRIKTERRLKPIQKKLERQVEGLDRDIAFKENQIRKAARQRVRDGQKLQRFEQTSRRDQRRIEALEASQLHGKKATPERIGHVVVTAEKRPYEQVAQAAKTREAPKMRPKPAEVDKHVETMSRAELLNLSERVPVENTTLRQVYETHLVGEQGLRRLVSEHVRGGDVQKVLREELLEHEIDFERDPILRDRPRDAISGGASASEGLQQLLKKAHVFTEDDSKEELAVLKARQAHQERRQSERQHRRLMDVSMVVAIGVLFGLVIMLLLR